MLYYSKLRLWLVSLVCLLGVVLCLPNFMKAPFADMPWRKIHLGLDLQGGSFLLLQLDMETLEHDQLQSLLEEVRRGLIKKNLGFVGLKILPDENAVAFAPRGPQEADAAFGVLQTLAEATSETHEAVRQNGLLMLKIHPSALRNRAREAVTRAIEIVRRRIDATGAVDPAIAREGENRIIVELPGVSDPERLKTLLGTTAKLTFRLVAPNPSIAPPGSSMLKDQQTGQMIAVMDHVDVDGADLVNAGAGLDSQSGGWAVNFRLNSRGAEDFGSVTRTHVGQRFAIVLDRDVIEAPRIISPITGGNGQITGGFTSKTASNLAILLSAGALPAPLKIVQQQSIGPTLGKASIRAGILSLALGLTLVVAFMVLFYGQFGVYADFSLVINLILMIAVLSLFGATLTLPGMAGILLTLGMAVDANILINARIREEMENGASALLALQRGFEKARGTVIDSNATAFLAHVMLFVFGTGPVRNFALTITIGIVTTLFAVLIVTPLLIIRWYARVRPRELPV